jgi:solute carrier family 25 carnitine/acylcarnitine transporter 20/29
MSSSSTGIAGAAKLNAALDKNPPLAIADKIPHLPETAQDLKADAEVVATKSMAGLRSLVAGGFGGVCAVVVGHPFDLVKVRLQTAEKGVYKSAIDVVRKSVAKDGLARGLYAGVSAPLVGVTPMCKFILSMSSIVIDLRGLSLSPSLFQGWMKRLC